MRSSLLPYRYKIAGWCLMAAGTILTIGYLSFDFVLRVPVFAVYSAFLETKTFTILPTNLADELILLAFLCGFTLVIFSRERRERKTDRLLRFKAMVRAVLLNTALLLFAVLFIYGTGFVVILLGNLFSTALFYLIIFYLLRWKTR